MRMSKGYLDKKEIVRFVLLEVEIKTTREYTQEELNEMVNEFKRCGFGATASVGLLKKGLEVPPDVMIILTFVLGMTVGEFVAGFFKKMGADTWDLLKKGMKEAFKKEKEEMYPRILIEVPVSENDIIICFITTESEDEFEEALNSLPKFLDKSKLKIEDVRYQTHIFYDREDGWHLPKKL